MFKINVYTFFALSKNVDYCFFFPRPLEKRAVGNKSTSLDFVQKICTRAGTSIRDTRVRDVVSTSLLMSNGPTDLYVYSCILGVEQHVRFQVRLLTRAIMRLSVTILAVGVSARDPRRT